jgi:hypothetical protein
MWKAAWVARQIDYQDWIGLECHNAKGNSQRKGTGLGEREEFAFLVMNTRSSRNG